MLDPWFAQPGFLLALLALPLAAVCFLYAHFRRRRSLAQLGNVISLRKGILLRPRVRRWKIVCVLTALALLAIACARPQWGRDPQPLQRAGRDVILVLDLSRSMLAEQPSRRELALRALRDLADTFEEQGGNRVALVLFAARAKLVFPLTQDYEHLRQTLTRIKADDYPPLSDKEVVSGTRIGAALKVAVEACEPARANRPMLVLLSDGDDPVHDDEWLEGVTEAKKQQLRVLTVGIGDPSASHTIPHGKERLEFEGEPIRTKLNEALLQEIAQRTGGVYLAARTHTLPLGIYVQHLLDADALREEEPPETALPVYQQRYAWFLLPAVLLLMLALLLNEGSVAPRRPAMPQAKPARFVSTAVQAPAAVLVLTAVMLVSAAPAVSMPDLVRLGNEAYVRQEYDQALQYYEQAETLAQDPGLVAFNKAAAYYRLRKYREAIESYRRCLDDDRAPPGRRAGAYFDLGNALLQDAGKDPQLLAEAAAAFRACLWQPDLPPTLRADARHNLEIAQLLWLRAQPPPKKDANGKSEDKPPAPPPTDTVALKPAPDAKQDNGQDVPVDPRDPTKPMAQPGQAGKKSDRLTSGGVPLVLPDQDKVVPFSIADTLATLEQAAQRIAAERREKRHPGGPLALSSKDW